MSGTRPWYHRPEWVTIAIIGAGSVVGGATALAHNDAQTVQNATDIRDLKAKVDPIPERLTRIETKLDDLTRYEKAKGG